MSRDQTIQDLARRADVIRAFGARALFLYGSVARNERRTDSDLDLFIDYAPESEFSLIELTGLKRYLETELGTKVDLTTRDSLHPLLRSDIERDAVRVF